jgi:hypothetical protein
MPTYDLRPYHGSAVSREIVRLISGFASPCTLITRNPAQAELVERVVERMRERGMTESRVIVDVKEVPSE